jgi:hypothetical protein
MSVTPILVGSNMNMPRSYISGFVGSVGVTNMVFAGRFVRFDYLAPLIRVDLWLKPEFEAPNSNVYTLDWIFDWSLSQVYVSGSPVAAGVGYRFVAMQSEPTWRIQVLATLGIDETQKLDLVPLSGYWRPIA